LQAKIDIACIWSDEDLLEFDIQVCDGSSLFVTKAYVPLRHLKDVVAGLHAFKAQIYGGLYDLNFGTFGREFANGAVQVRLHFQKLGKIHLTVQAQSHFFPFGAKEVAREATLFLVAEPAALDDFVRALEAIAQGFASTATLPAFEPEPA
jgi:hypothetical protein